MSLLLNKRNRDESPNEYNNININSENNFQIKNTKNYLDYINNNNDNISEDNASNNIKDLELFQQMFNSINSRKEDINQNNIIMSPLFRSSLFFGSIQKLKNIDKLIQSNDKSKFVSSDHNSNLSFLKNKTSSNNKNKLFFSHNSSLNIDKNLCDGFTNFDKFPLNLDFTHFNFSEKKNAFELNSENKVNNENKIDIFGNKITNFFDSNIFNNTNNKNRKQSPISSQKGNKADKLQLSKSNDFIGVNPINTSLFMTKNPNKNKKLKNHIITKNKKLLGKIKTNKSLNNFISSKPFQTYTPRLFQKSFKNSISKPKSNKPKIFHIEKIFNKKEYKDANEKEKEDDLNVINRFKITLKKIKQIYKNSCLKIYSYINEKSRIDESKLNDEIYISNIIKQVCEVIKSKKINSSKMNEILQVNDDDKYRKHYFMFTSDAKQFCLDLINKKHFSFDIVMKMCKVPRKSLRRWSYVGCHRKKGCGRKTKNPQMEEKLVQWYNDMVKKGFCITAKMIREKAVEISEDKDFLASKGWLEKFKKKFNIRIMNGKNKKFRRCLSSPIKNNEVCDEQHNNKMNMQTNEEKNRNIKDLKIKKLLFVKTKE